MKVTEKEFYKVLEVEGENLHDFISFLKEKQADFKKDNLIVDLLKHEKFKLKELVGLLAVSQKHGGYKKSFAIVNTALLGDEISEELTVVPTLGEAVDFIQMEEIERDLGA